MPRTTLPLIGAQAIAIGSPPLLGLLFQFGVLTAAQLLRPRPTIRASRRV